MNMTEWVDTHVPDWLSQQRGSKKVAIEYEGEFWTYGQLYERAGRLAGYLASLGAQAGERIALLARHGLVFANTVHSIIQLEAILVPLNTRLSATELVWQLRDAGVHMLIYDSDHRELAQQVVESLRTSVAAGPIEVELDGVHWNEDELPIYHEYIVLTATQSLMYTSGTTGRPKAARISYKNQLWGALGSALRLGVQPDDRWLTPLPLFHVGGQSVLLRSVIYGTTAVVHAAFDPVKVNQALCEQGVTLVSVVPVMLSRMLGEQTEPYPNTLRNVLLGGGPAPRLLLDVCIQQHVPVSQSYGLTEANSQVATLSIEDSLRKIGSAGRALAFTEVCIMGEDGPVDPYQEGEIVLRGPTVITGYENNPEADERAFRNGFFYTGDIGYVDSEGYLYVLDRRADMIVSGGENVYPAEVEATLLAHEDIMDAGVFGMPDERFGQLPFAVVKVRLGVTLDIAELKKFCRKHIAGYKIPRKIVCAAELPRNASGKLLRRELLKWL